MGGFAGLFPALEVRGGALRSLRARGALVGLVGVKYLHPLKCERQQQQQQQYYVSQLQPSGATHTFRFRRSYYCCRCCFLYVWTCLSTFLKVFGMYFPLFILVVVDVFISR